MGTISVVAMAHSQETRSERISAGKEAPTLKDQEIKSQSCAPLLTLGKPLQASSFEVGPVFELILQEFDFLPLTDFHLGEDDVSLSVSMWPPLPYGGISALDFCKIGWAVYLEEPTPSARNVVRQGILLRPNLDLEADYPTTFGIVSQQEDRLQTVPAGRYVVYQIPGDDPSGRAKEIGLLLAGNPLPDFALTIGEWIIVKREKE